MKIIKTITLLFLLLAATIFVILTFYHKPDSKTSGSLTSDIAPEVSVKDGCTRTMRLENKPQYERALSLINQRVSENNEMWPIEGKYSDARFNYFPDNLTNCIQIIEEDIDGDAEGYFIFNSEDIKPNYFPIVVDKRYKYSDDVLTAMLITHELTHVQQYLDELNGTNDLSCRNKEVEAFISQLEFYTTLNAEENKSMILKMNDSSGRKHPQVRMLKTMIEINKLNNCSIMDTECSRTNLRSKLFELITNDSSYSHQCDLTENL